MNLPLVEIGTLLAKQGCLREHRQNVLAAQRDVAELRPRATIGIGRRKRVFAQCEDDQRGVHIGLKAEVAMDVLGKFAGTADKPWCGVKTEAGVWFGSTLTGKPIRIVSEKALAPSRYRVALLEGHDSVGDVEPQELTQVGANQVAQRLTTKNCRRRELPTGAGPKWFSKGIDVADSRSYERVFFVVAEWYIPRQRQPVDLRHFACHPGAGKRRRRIKRGRGAIETHQIERVGCLRVVQCNLGGAVARDCLKAARITASQHSYECLESLNIDLANFIMWEGFRKARTLVRIACFVAIGRVHWQRLIKICLRCGLANLEGRYLPS